MPTKEELEKENTALKEQLADTEEMNKLLEEQVAEQGKQIEALGQAGMDDGDESVDMSPEEEVQMAQQQIEKAKARIAAAEKMNAEKMVNAALKYHGVDRKFLDTSFVPGGYKLLPNGVRLFVRVMKQDKDGKWRQVDRRNLLYRPSMEKTEALQEA